MKRVAIIGLIAISLTVGCRVGPDYAPPGTAVPDIWHQQLEEGEYVGSGELDQWWTLLDDEILNELVCSASGSSLTLQAAYHRICQARAQRCIARAARLPQLNASSSFITALQSANAFGGGGFGAFFSRDLWSYGADVAWEPDLFGRVARQIEAADANVCAQVELYRDILVTLYGDVAQTYVQVRTIQGQLRYAHENVAIQERALELARRRVEGGIAPNVDQFQAQSNLASTQAEIPPLEQRLHQALNRLAVLLGHCPGSLHEPLTLTSPIPRVPDYLPLVIPCDMVRQRPDIRNAERLVHARTAEVGVAIGDLYPRFNIGGNFGLSSQNFSSLFSSASWGYSLGPSVTWPIFQAGRIRCGIESARAQVCEAIANYEQTVLLALEEVENAIVAFKKERARRKKLIETVEAAQNSLESVLALYREGKTDFQNVLDTQRTLFTAQNNLAVSEGQVIANLVQIYRALGGGWDPCLHRHNACAHAVCPPRIHPEAVEDININDDSARYFETPPAGDAPEPVESEPPVAEDGIRDPADPLNQPPVDDPPQNELPPPRLDTRPNSRTKDALDDLLEELEDRLKTRPADESPIDG